LRHASVICISDDDTRTRRRTRTAVIAAICVFCILAAIFLSLAFIFWKNRRGVIWRRPGVVQYGVVVAPGLGPTSKPLDATTVASIDLAAIEKATRNFSDKKVIGGGAFGIVYEV
jgi:hypothetical protein